MSEAQEALADVRGWLCDNLSDGDAGEVCGMLSVVSRHINELETENITLQATKSYLLMNSSPTAWELRRVRIEWRKDRDENAKLREQIELLTTILRNDCDIDASWDGLRRFWSIGLTEGGCLMRDRACKAEAENAKLRKFAESYLDAVAMAGCHFCPYDDIDLCDTETDPMRDGCRLYEEMRELGVEVR